MKITKSNSNISSFGGINFANEFMDRFNIPETIGLHLGSRHLTAKYSYDDLFRTYFLMTLCGGECAEDVTEHLRFELEQVKNFNVCSADTLLRMQKELATKKEFFTSVTGVKHEFNINERLNKLLVNLLISTKLLNTNNKEYIFDYDNQFIPTEKYDSKRSYKQKNGYFPGIASIDGHPVYIENRNGNSNVKYKQDDTLMRAYNILKEYGIKIKYSRMDCGSFSEDIIKVVEENSELFYIRAQRCDSLFEKIQEITEWETVWIGTKHYQVASIEYTPFNKKKQYRYVITREVIDDKQGNLFTDKNYKYRAIITNDKEKSNFDIVQFYNHRGSSERLFDEMNNDFLWKKMPFSFLNENTVFLILTAICRNLFYCFKDYVSKKVFFIKPTFRLKKFIFRFMVVPAKWISRGRQDILKLFTKKPYHLLI